MKWASPAGAWAIPICPRRPFAFGGKYAYNDDQETPNTLLASFNYGDRELVFEVRGLLTGGEGTPARGAAGGRGGRAGRGAAGAAPPALRPPRPPYPVGPASNPLNVDVGDLFYGTEGWAAMSDQASRPTRARAANSSWKSAPSAASPAATPPACTCRTSSQACRSRNEKDLHDPLSQRLPERVALPPGQHQLPRRAASSTLEAGPKFTGDAEATKMLTREVYRKPYVV